LAPIGEGRLGKRYRAHGLKLVRPPSSKCPHSHDGRRDRTFAPFYGKEIETGFPVAENNALW